MRKSLFAIGLLAAASSVQAQNVLLHVDDAATAYVSKGTLVYNGGGLQMRGNGVIENHGNIMVSGASTDSFKTITTGGADKPEGSITANFVNKLNEPTAYATPNTNSSSATPAYTYGQLYISGIPQANITGIVDQEYRSIQHGTYQQIGLPFYDKTVSTLSADLGKNFSNVRGSQNEVLQYGNGAVVSYTVPTNYKLGIGGNSVAGQAGPAYLYYMIGASGLDVSTTTRTLKGRPLSDIGQSVTLSNAGNGINFGTGGNNQNMYGEKYNTYSQDRFEIASGGASWQGNYSRNIYQFANPFLTNLDLRNIAYNEPAANGDGVNLSNIYGVRLEPGQVTTNSSGTGATTAGKYITFNAGVPTGDVDYMMIRPMGTFQIKLNNNNNTDVLNFANLRRFNYYSRGASTDYSVTANKNASKVGTVKQLGVIGLDANGNEVGRTYYVVYPNGVSGYSSNSKTQVTARGGNPNTADPIGTYEEALTGGADPNHSNDYWLYINEANETNFKGKNIVLEINPDRVKSYKFEIREDAALINDGQHQLSAGTGFYYQAPNGSVTEAKQGDIIPVTSSIDKYNLYYGMPDRNVLAVEPVASTKPSKTIVVYNPDITNYIVRFDPSWKKADIEVYDMSGKLVLSKKSVDASTDFVIELNKAIKASYVVKVVSEKGETVNTKILK